MGGQPLDQAIGLVEQAGDRLVGLGADHLPPQAVLLGGQREPGAAVDVLGGGPVADVVHGEPPWSMSGRTASGDLSQRRSAAVPTASTTEVRSIGKCYARQCLIRFADLINGASLMSTICPQWTRLP